MIHDLGFEDKAELGLAEEPVGDRREAVVVRHPRLFLEKHGF